MRYEIVDTATGQEKLKAPLQGLFELCYSASLSDAQWHYLYLAPPLGNAISVAAWDDEGLVGHWAVTPMTAVHTATGERIVHGRGMALAIAPRGRAFGVLPELFHHVKPALLERGLDFVVAFPNQVSFMPLRIICGWKILHEAPFVTFPLSSDTPSEVVIDVRATLPLEGGFVPDYTDESYMGWRSTLRTFRSWVLGDAQLGVVGKVWEDNTLDIMDLYRLENPSVKAACPPYAAVSALARRLGLSRITLPRWHATEHGFPVEAGEVSEYVLRMGAMATGEAPIPELRFSLIFSDVF